MEADPVTPARWYVNVAAVVALVVLVVLVGFASLHHEQVAPWVGYGGGLGFLVGVPFWWMWRVFTEHHDVEVKR